MATTTKTIVFAGAGLSALTLAVEMNRHAYFDDYTFVLIDRYRKDTNDRTWCFWARPEENLPPVIHKTWEKSLFFGSYFEKILEMYPYQYHMIRSKDFYDWAQGVLNKRGNTRFVFANIERLDAESKTVHTDQGQFAGDWIINSAFTAVPVLPTGTDLYPTPAFSTLSQTAVDAPDHTFLLQHFKGWIIETDAPTFQEDQITLMDYRIDQHDDTRFVYVLPLSDRRALIEFTVFSPALLSAEAYDNELNKYIKKYLNISEYRVEETEFGVIPMTDYPLEYASTEGVLHIGTAAGFVKSSSGYAFLRTQRKSKLLVAQWIRDGKPNINATQSPWHLRLCDTIMLRVLRDKVVGGSMFFSRLFERLPAPLVFKFLDEDVSPVETLRVMNSVQLWPFIKTTFKLLPAYVRLSLRRHWRSTP